MCSGLQKAFGTDEILQNVSFVLEEKEKAALVGVNGAGKTSVFRLLTGEWRPDAGEIHRATGTGIGYLSQMTDVDSDRTLFDELNTVFEPIRQLEAQIRQLEQDMSGQAEDALAATMARYSRLTAAFEDRKGYEAQSRLRGVLKGLGFTEGQWQQPWRTLSGGQQTRAALGKLLLTAPDLLLLDEPTNHLDIESIVWLEDYLRAYPGGILLISHDRYFLDRITTKTIEIENKKSSVYNGPYSVYAQQKAANREIALRQYFAQQKEIKRQEKAIQTIRGFKTEAALIRAKSREKLLDKMERVEKPEALPDQMRLALTPKIETGYDVLTAEGLAMAFAESKGKKLFEGISFALKKGDKTALVGPNGIGKSTLVKIIMGQLQQVAGRIRPGVHLRVGYFDQTGQYLSPEKTLFQELADTYPRLSQTEIRNVLAAFMFTGDDVFKPISLLSGGERGRVALAKIMLGGANLLILDEPTNHLDMFSKEILEQALRDFPATVLYISHDRYFINHTATKIWEMSPTGLTEYLGNYDYYREKKAQAQASASASVVPVESEAAPAARPENDWKAKKAAESAARKQKAQQERLARSIAELETQIADCEALLATEEIARSASRVAEIFAEKEQLEEALLELYATQIEGVQP